MSENRCNIVLLILDTARGDVVNEMIEAGELPHISSLTRGGQLYTNAKANGPWTVPSHASMFTGDYPCDHGVTGEDPSYESVPLVEELRALDYTTAAFSANPWLGSEFGFISTFDTSITPYEHFADGMSFANVTGGPRFGDKLSVLIDRFFERPSPKSVYNLLFFLRQRYFRRDSGGKHLLGRASSWLESADSPSFVFINVTEPHLPHSLPDSMLPAGISQQDLARVNQDPGAHNTRTVSMNESDFALLRKTYRATLRYIDQFVEGLVQSTTDDTTIILAGDHGDHFGEHDRFGHQYSLFEELLHVPLIINGPHTNGERIDDPVELRHLYDYVLDLARANAPRFVERSETTVAEYLYPLSKKMIERSANGLPDYVRQYANGARSITAEGHKLVELSDGSELLLRLHDDGEIRSDDERRADRLRRRLHDEFGPLRTVETANYVVSESVEDRLNDLGYL